MTVNGIDVASYQSAAYSTAGLGFVFVKATEGTGYINPEHAAQISHGRAAGLVVGHYHFARPGSMTAQATYFLQHAAARPGDLLCLDWEDTGVPDHDAAAFIGAVQSVMPHNRVLLYCNKDFWLNRDHSSFVGDGLWIADPGAPAGHPQIQHSWVIHQYSEAGGLDHDVANFADKAALQAWAAKGVTPPAPKPPKPPAPRPHVDLSNLVAAARTDPHAAQGHTSHPADVHLVEAALKAERLLPAAYAGDGSYGSKTILAYAAWQRHLGYAGADANGIPGAASLTKLGQRHGFTVTA